MLARSGGNPVTRSVSSAPMLRAAIDAVVALNRHGWRPGYETEFRGSLKHVSALYDKRVDGITSADILSVLEPLWNTKAVTAKRLKQRLNQVMEWAIASGHTKDNPVTTAKRALPKQVKKVTHRDAVPHQGVKDALIKVQDSNAHPVVTLAIEFCVLTAARSGEVRGMTWAEIDGNTWTVPADRIKAGLEHRVPLSGRALEILEAVRPYSTDTLVFSVSRAVKSISSSTLPAALHNAGVNGSLHGFRSSFRDWCSESGIADRVAETCLAHAVPDAVQAAYLRTDLFEQRAEVMERWARYVAA